MDRRFAFHTPEQITGDTIVRMIVSPVDLISHIGGALGELLEENNWDEIGVTIDETIKAVQTMVDFFYGPSLVGMVASFVGELPLGWLLLDGSTISQSDYPELAAVVPSSWLSGSDIILPNIADSFVVGAGNLYNLGTEGGETNHTLTIDEIPSHNHTYQPPAINLDVEGPGVPDAGATVLGPISNTGNTGGGESHNNVPPYLALNYGVFSGRDYV
jgi:microcystin-dependent protein